MPASKKTTAPRMVVRVLTALTGLPACLITTKRLAEALGVSHGALLIHTANPLLREFRLERGASVFWGNPATVASHPRLDF